MDRYASLSEEFPPRDRTLSTLLKRQAEKYRDKPLVTCGDARWSFEQTARVAETYAQYLAHAGVKGGDRVAIHSSNRHEFLQIFLGCAWLGAIATPINTAFRGAQLAHVMNNAEPSLLVLESRFLPVYDDLPEGTRVPDLVWRIEDDAIMTSQGDLATAGAGHGAVVPCTAPADTVAILYTSGTTGPSKGVCCPQAQMFWWGVYSARALGLREGDVLMTTLPIFHTNALNTFYQALVIGCEYVLEPKFSASRFWDRARDAGATVTYLLGAMAAILMAQPARRNDRDHKVRVALGGGVPAPMQLPFLDRFGVPLVDGYASTETNFAFYTPAPSDYPGSMGYLAPGAEALIVDKHQMPLPDGQAGELLLRPTEPYSFASGYFGMPDKTVEAWQNLWFHTGDRVVREPEGYFRFIDRTKDAIRRRGENVSSWEVEQVILSHTAIEACAAYPVPSELGEDEVAVAVKLKSGARFDELELIKYVETRLAYFAVPRYLRVIDEMPLTENGKVKKVVLRSDGIVEGMWDLDRSGYKIKR